MTTTTVIERNTKQTAAELRTALRQAFPSVKFAVRMARGTAYGWLSVGWTDGPTTDAVDAITRRYESMRFDGMDDSYHQVTPPVDLIDGVPTEVHYSCCGINSRRAYSPEAETWAARRAQPGTESWAHAEGRGHRDVAYTAMQYLLSATNFTV